MQAANDKINKLTLLLANAGQDKMIAKDYSSKLKEDTFSLEQKIVDLSNNNKRLQDLCNDYKNQNLVLTNSLRTSQIQLSDELIHNPMRPKSPETTHKKMNDLMRSLEKERDTYKGQVQKLQNKIQKSAAQQTISDRADFRSPSPSQNQANTMTALQHIQSSNTTSQQPSANRKSDEFLAVIQQRDSLQTALERFEAHMSEIQTNLKIVRTERDNALKESYNTRQELDKLRSLVISDNEAKTAANQVDISNVVLKTLEQERDQALECQRQATNNKETLEQRYWGGHDLIFTNVF